MRFSAVWFSCACVVLPACGNDKSPPASPTSPSVPTTTGSPPSTAAASTGSPYQLAKEPAGAIAVLAAKAKGEAKGVVVVGRLKDTVPGFAAFTLTDASLKYCGQEGTEDGCQTPWDYCCIPADDVAAATINVGIRTKGEVVAVAVPELRNMDLVVVHGTLVKGADGELRLDADGWYRKERPVVPATVVFPK